MKKINFERIWNRKVLATIPILFLFFSCLQLFAKNSQHKFWKQMKSGGLYREYVRAFYQGNNGFGANYDLLFDKIKV